MNLTQDSGEANDDTVHLAATGSSTTPGTSKTSATKAPLPIRRPDEERPNPADWRQRRSRDGFGSPPREQTGPLTDFDPQPVPEPAAQPMPAQAAQLTPTQAPHSLPARGAQPDGGAARHGQPGGGAEASHGAVEAEAGEVFGPGRLTRCRGTRACSGRTHSGRVRY